MGGINSLLSIEHSPSIPVISKVPTIIIGMDVSHGTPGRAGAPSVAALCNHQMVSSRPWPLISRHRAVVRTQSPKTQMIDSLCSSFLYKEKELRELEFLQLLHRNLENIEMTSACFGSVFNHLDLLNPVEVIHVQKLKFELRLLRTFLMCKRKSNNQWLFSAIEETIHRHAHDIQALCLSANDEFAVLNPLVSFFLEGIEFFEQQILKNYEELSDGASQSESPKSDDVMEFLDSVIENLVDLLSWDERVEKYLLLRIELLEDKFQFLKNFVQFATLRGVEHCQLQDLLVQVELLSIRAAHFSYLCWKCEGEKVVWWPYLVNANAKLIEDIMYPFVKMYIQVLTPSKWSGSSQFFELEVNKRKVGDFIDSLLGYLWDLKNWHTSFMVYMKDQVQMLFEGLRFLRSILGNQQEKFDELHKETQEFIGAVISEAGVVCLKLVDAEQQALDRETVRAVYDLLEKINLIKTAVAVNHPGTSKLSSPTTNELGFMDSLLRYLNELGGGEGSSITYVQDQIQVIERGLEFLRSFLDKIVDQRNHHEELQALWSRVIEVAYEAESVIDSIMVGDINCPPMSLKIIIQEIKLIKIEARLIIDSRGCDIKVQKDTKTSSLVPSQGNVLFINEVVVHLDDEKEQIIDRLTRGKKQLDIVPIVGMLGLGKTTLAKTVHQDPSVRFHFHINAWCSVSQVYSKKDLLLEILGHTTSEASNKHSKMDENDLALALCQRLKGHRYLIVLDDLWSIEAWNVLKASFPDDGNGSRVLFTSRFKDLALQIQPDSAPHPIRFLTDYESWELLERKLFGKESCPPTLRPLGKEIARNCNGLPLTVVIVAGILATLDARGWENFLKSPITEIVGPTEQCRYILEMSYKHLPDHLKPCFLYFGAFLENREVRSKSLMWLWIAEGFVQNIELKSLEDVAENYMMHLISRSLVMVAKQSSLGGVRTCRIHDLLHEFAMKKAREENFLQSLCRNDEHFKFHEAGNLRRLCIYNTAKHLKESRQYCPRLRSLILFARGDDRYQFSSSWERKTYNYYFFLNISNILRVLDISQIEIGQNFPTEIELLIQLRYLAVRAVLVSIPPEITKLWNLQTLIMKGVYSVLISPGSFWEMKKLRHLHVGVGNSTFNLPYTYLNEESCGLYHLQTMSTPIFCYGECMEKTLKMLPNLRKLKCQLSIPESSGTSSGECKRIFALDSLSRLEALNVRPCYRNRQCHILFPLNLKRLVLADFCWQWSEISAIGKLPNLEVLKLLHKSFVGEVWDMKEGEFHKLRFFTLDCLDIVHWRGSDDHFPNLQKLVLSGCRQLKEIPDCLGSIPAIEIIEVRRCNESTEDLAKQIQEEQMAYGNDMKLVIHS